MKILLDTNILLRIAEPASAHRPCALEALRRLARDGHVFCIGSQTVSEFLAVATRSVTDRGLGMDQATADAELSKVTSALDVLFDSASVLTELRRLVLAHGVIGKTVHDAKLVAAMNCNGIKYILTFNVRDFSRYAGITVLDPIVVGQSGPSPTT